MLRPTIVWFRRDFRLSDHAALAEASRRGGPVIPVYIFDEEAEALGAAPTWRMGEAVRAFGATLGAHGSRLILRRGPAKDTLLALVAETGAEAVYWSRAYLPDQVARDTAVKAALADKGLEAKSFPGHVLFEPWTVQTKTGGFYKVYTPFWKAVRDSALGAPLATVTTLPAPETWPDSAALDDWHLDGAMHRGAPVLSRYARVGEAAARARLDRFLADRLAAYDTARDHPAEPGTSGLSENLTHGEISPRQVWTAAMEALAGGNAGAETFAKEIVWRDFAYHLAWHSPQLLTGNWKPDWDAFPWKEAGPSTLRWQQGRTGIRFVDAAMRELYTTGTMHNRGRMIVASFLTKHLMTHWKVGLDWFADCLIDWDPAANAMGWQWAAGSGPDAAPFFRIFNPDTQLDKFDPRHRYPERWIAEMSPRPGDDALAFYEAIPRRWDLAPDARYPGPIIDLRAGRERALAAYHDRDAA